jgi:hypothetical protein
MLRMLRIIDSGHGLKCQCVGGLCAREDGRSWCLGGFERRCIARGTAGQMCQVAERRTVIELSAPIAVAVEWVLELERRLTLVCQPPFIEDYCC